MIFDKPTFRNKICNCIYFKYKKLVKILTGIFFSNICFYLRLHYFLFLFFILFSTKFYTAIMHCAEVHQSRTCSYVADIRILSNNESVKGTYG